MITAPPPKQYPIPDEGHYLLKISKIADKQKMTQWGERTKIVFTLEVAGTDNGDGQPMRVFLEHYKSMGKPTKPSYLAKFTEKVLGRKLKSEEYQEFDELGLLNRTVEAELVHNTAQDGRTFANVDEVYKNRSGAKPEPQPVPHDGHDMDEETPF